MADEMLNASLVANAQEQYSVAPGVVSNNFDLLAEGRVQVRIPSRPALSPWARIVAPGGGTGRGVYWIPQVGDEVLVAFNQNDERDAYVLGGLWSTMNRPPGGLTDALTKRVIRTGVLPGIGHKIEFDDLSQSITITTSMQDTITVGPLKVEIEPAGGMQKITLSTAPPGISIEATVGNIELSAPVGRISLNGAQVEINGELNTTVKSSGPSVVEGLPVKIN